MSHYQADGVAEGGGGGKGKKNLYGTVDRFGKFNQFLRHP
jgi:hypothetical protein